MVFQFPKLTVQGVVVQSAGAPEQFVSVGRFGFSRGEVVLPFLGLVSVFLFVFSHLDLEFLPFLGFVHVLLDLVLLLLPRPPSLFVFVLPHLHT